LGLVDQLSLLEEKKEVVEKWKKPKDQFEDASEEEDDDDDHDWNIAEELNGEKPKGEDVSEDRFADAEDEKEQTSKHKRKSKAPQDVDLRDFEVGEYGFPLDGYNYAQHFKTMGSQGAVFMESPFKKEPVAYKKVRFRDLLPWGLEAN